MHGGSGPWCDFKLLHEAARSEAALSLDITSTSQAERQDRKTLRSRRGAPLLGLVWTNQSQLIPFMGGPAFEMLKAPGAVCHLSMWGSG